MYLILSHTHTHEYTVDFHFFSLVMFYKIAMDSELVTTEPLILEEIKG